MIGTLMTRSSVVILFLGLLLLRPLGGWVGGVRCVTLVATLQGREMTIWEYLGTYIFFPTGIENV